MPLRDHPVVRGLSPWQRASFHSAWTTYIMQGLNRGVLPRNYYARPTVHVGNRAQVDIGTLHDAEAAAVDTSNGAVATAVWAPPKPPLVELADLADLDVFEIEVRDEDTGFDLVAAIELVSPANKDRPEHRNAFVAKCAAYLQRRIGLVVVDIIHERRENLHASLMDLIQVGDAARNAISAEMSAVAYRAAADDGRPARLEMWPTSLQVGAALPVLPLWIGPELAVPLDLEASYAATLEGLRLA